MSRSMSVSCAHHTHCCANNTLRATNHQSGHHNTNQSGQHVITTLNCSDIGIDVNNYSISSQSCSRSTRLPSKCVLTIPFGWRREMIDENVCYISPSNCQLSSLSQVSTYLQSDG